MLSSGIDAALCCCLRRTCDLLLYCSVLYCHYSIERMAMKSSSTYVSSVGIIRAMLIIVIISREV